MTIMDSLTIERCREGDAYAIERMVEMYQRDVYRLALSILDDPREAEDATQDVFIAALRNLDSFRGQAAFKTWLFSIAINVSRSRLQRRKSRERLQSILRAVFQTQPAQRHPEEEAVQRQADAAVWRAIQTLDEKHRLPVILRYYHDLPVSDIADMLGIPAGTVHSRLNHARERLRTVLKEV
ncbi:MAG: sigma-70 family RNA polymerase sigma factor [Anaerolineales bacterium]